MSLMIDCPAHSSSNSEFAAFLDSMLDSTSDASLTEVDDDNYEFDLERIERRKLEEIVVSSQDSMSRGPNLEAFLEENRCIHPCFFGGMCVVCGQKMLDPSDVSFGYIHKGLSLGGGEITRISNRDFRNLLCHKRFYLVHDLDRTLLNSTQIMDITPEEEFLKYQTDFVQGDEQVDEIRDHSRTCTQ